MIKQISFLLDKFEESDKRQKEKIQVLQKSLELIKGLHQLGCEHITELEDRVEKLEKRIKKCKKKFNKKFDSEYDWY